MHYSILTVENVLRGLYHMCNKVSSVAIIGSFKQYYDAVCKSLTTFLLSGLKITTPKGSKILKPGIPFVRFESDNPDWTDEMVQVVTLQRIFQSDFVFVVVQDGYIGCTTCYEIGRIVQAGKPLYFSDRPKDLPLWIPDSHICSADQIVEHILSGTFQPEILHANVSNAEGYLEQELLNGRYNNI